MVKKRLSGWSAYPPQQLTDVLRPENTDEIVFCGEKIIPRGQGRSYGDAAMNSNYSVILSERLNRFLSFDVEKGIIRLEAGVSFDELLSVIVPRGWFLPVTPGTKFVTLGGAISADVHGKNHHREGSFGDHVLEFNLRLANQALVTCSRDQNADLFHAAVGGFGLLGLIEEASISLKKIETAFICQKTYASRNFEETIGLLEANDHATYSVAWIDGLASEKALGRGIVLLGEHAKEGDLPEALKKVRLKLQTLKERRIPKFFPFTLTRLKVKIFNALYYSIKKNQSDQTFNYFEDYFYPLDAVSGWNRIYGKRGFLQFQCVLPMKSYREGLSKIMGKISKSGNASFLTVLKRFGPESFGFLSFPFEGYTLAVDLPFDMAALSLVRELNQITCDYEGRLYFAKDACMLPEHFLKMYPKYASWKKIKDQYDPECLFSSDLSRRLMEKVL